MTYLKIGISFCKDIRVFEKTPYVDFFNTKF
jgi:hypothetical protein